nr:PEP-CTERM sorting domain-containing protein [uncultured Roseateles sp.]
MSFAHPSTAHSSQPSHLRPAAIALALLACGLATPASALDYVWQGGTGNWEDPSKWSLLGIPGAGDSALINSGNAAVNFSGTRSLAALFLTNGYFGGTGTLNTGSASFGSAVLGLSDAATQGTLNVSGAASFDGTRVQSLRYGQVINLNGNTSWSVGNGRIEVNDSFAGNSNVDPYRKSAINIASGTTFTDAGAAAAAGTKVMGYQGGTINNAGTYVRNGLGTTEASYGFNNTGTVQINGGTFRLTGSSSSLRGESSGQVNVAAGAVFDLGNADITAGAINNSGRVTMSTNSVATIAAGTAINGAWELNHSSAQLQQSGNHSISSLTLTNGYLGGTGTLNTGSASFGSFSLGWSDAATQGTLNVSGNASFDGSRIQALRYGQVINLNGNTSWSVGNGRIEVNDSFAGNSNVDPYRKSAINIASGTTFTDAGAAAAAGTKIIGYQGGTINNAGTFVRNGLGTTEASYGFNNTGTVQINGGTFRLTGSSSSLRGESSGQVNVAAGAVFDLGNADITAGAINNSGRVTMSTNSVATVAAGTTINGAWELNHSSAQLQQSGNHSISSLTLTNGYLGGTGTLNTGSASFGSVSLGWSDAATQGTLNVSGNASFDGTRVQALRYGQVINLNGNTSWSVGNGRIEVNDSFAGNSNVDPYRKSAINIASGTTFTDAGAAAAAGTKIIGYQGGTINNAGTFVRNGLGTTEASYGFNNTGTVQINGGTFRLTGSSSSLRGESSGQVNVAAGAVFDLGNADITAGAINNSGRVTMSTNSVATIAAGTSINGAWELNHSSAQLQQSGNHSISSLTLTNGYLGGTGTLNTGSASFGSVSLGWSDAATQGTLNVSGNASFDGSRIQALRYGQVINLNGNTSWSVGNGRIEVNDSFAGNSNVDPYRKSAINIASGTTFTDAGAAAAAGTKIIGYQGGTINNAGTYVRNGLGTTEASHGFNNTGTVEINAGRFTVDQYFQNLGTVNVASGAVLKGRDNQFRNDGTLQGAGTVETYSANDALNNLGRINPGSVGTGGTLTFTGDLSLGSTGTLNIDLVALGANDRVAISDDLSVSGTLAVWAAGYSLNLGDSFVIATFGKLAAGSSFSSVTWNGLPADAFAVVYNAHDITLRVTAVPEPQTWAMLMGGIAALSLWRRRAKSVST